MNFHLTIGCVDSSTITIHSTNAKFVSNVLDEHDHEGSAVSLTVEAANEDAYKLLQNLGTL